MASYSSKRIIRSSISFRKGIGFGNGQKKSKIFSDFVANCRDYLRREMKLCERMMQRILCYSNNFLYKQLKTESVRILS